MTKFPLLIHVTKEGLDGDDPWFAVHPRGVFDLDKPGQAVAIYRLADQGQVAITKAFIKGRSKKR